MGGMAIATLAGDHIDRAGIDDYFSSTGLVLPHGATADLDCVETFAGSTTVKVPRAPRARSAARRGPRPGAVRIGVTARYSFGWMWRRVLG